MKLPRISVGAIMASLVVIAFDLAIYRSIRARPLDAGLSPLLLATLPMANVLFVGIASLVRGRGWSRPFLVGFEFGGWCGLAIMAAVIDPGMRLLESVFESAGLERWFMASPASQALGILIFAVGLPFFLQFLVALTGARIARRLADERGPAPAEASNPAQHPFRSLAVLVALVALPMLAVEGTLRWKVDRSIARFPEGATALVSVVDTFGIKPMAPGSPTLIVDGCKVQIEQDDSPNELELMEDVTLHIRDRRAVRVKVLDGSQAGVSLDVKHYMLKPSP